VLYRKQILAPWGTVVVGLLSPCLTTLGPAAAAHGSMSLPSWVTALCPSHPTGPLLAVPTTVPHGGMLLSPWVSHPDLRANPNARIHVRQDQVTHMH
jgi:hypothetical protein